MPEEQPDPVEKRMTAFDFMSFAIQFQSRNLSWENFMTDAIAFE